MTFGHDFVDGGVYTIGLVVIVCVLGCGYCRYTEKQADSRTRRVQPISAAERRAALESARRERERGVAPKVHAYPQLNRGGFGDLSVAGPGLAGADVDDKPPSTAGSEALGEAGRWAKNQMVSDRSAAARAAARGDADLHGSDNNIIMQGGGVGFFRDEHEADPSKRFKAFGGGTGRQGPGGVSACFGPGGNTHCISGTGTSPDGLVWSNATMIKWPAPQRCACPPAVRAHVASKTDTSASNRRLPQQPLLGESLMSTA